MDIPIDYQINDRRSLEYFKKLTFSNYEKKSVLSELKKNIIDYRLEPAVYWSTELIISGCINEIIDIINKIACLYINKTSPQFPIFLYDRICKIDTILLCYEKKNLEYRNDQQLRNIICEIISVLTISTKKLLAPVKKMKETYFNIDILKNRLQAKNLELIQNVMRENDPAELQIACNEFAYCLNNNSSSDLVFFWLSWILTWEKKIIKKQGRCICAYRDIVESKESNTDVIWLIWDIIVNETNKRNNINFKKSIDALFSLFKKNYKSSLKSKRIDFIIYSIILIVDTKDYDIPMNNLLPIVLQSCCNINLMYQNAKKNEISNQKTLLDNRIIRNDYLITKKKEKDLKQNNSINTNSSNNNSSNNNSSNNNSNNTLAEKIIKKNSNNSNDISEKKMALVFDIDNQMYSTNNSLQKKTNTTTEIKNKSYTIAEKMIDSIDKIIFNK